MAKIVSENMQKRTEFVLWFNQVKHLLEGKVRTQLTDLKLEITLKSNATGKVAKRYDNIECALLIDQAHKLMEKIKEEMKDGKSIRK